MFDVLLSVAFLSISFQPERCVSIPEVVDASLSVSPAMTQAEVQREIARAQVLAERAQGRPQVNLFGQAGIGDRQPLDQSRDDQIGISANLEIFTFGRRSAAITAAREQLRAAQAGELQAQIDIAQQAIVLAFELIRTDKIVDLTTAQTVGYAKDADSVEQRLQRGLVTRSDARQIEARFAESLARREEAELRRDQIAVQLSVITSADIPCVEETSAERLGSGLRSVLGEVSPDEAVLLAERNALTLTQAEAQVRSAEARLRQASRAGRPSLSINAFVLGEYDDSEFPIEDRWDREDRIGFAVRQELFAGGRLRADRAEQRSRLRGALAGFEQERQRLEIEVRSSVLSAMRQGAIASRRQAAATASLDRLEATTMELDRGTKTITDFVLANDDYYNAAINEANAAFQRDEDLVRVAALTGLLLSIDLERSLQP